MAKKLFDVDLTIEKTITFRGISANTPEEAEDIAERLTEEEAEVLESEVVFSEAYESEAEEEFDA